MRGKCALITGSTSGLGYAIANRLAAEGCRIVLNGLAPPQDAEAMRAKLARAHGVEARYHPADLAAPREIVDMMEFAEREFGGVDILVNNAVVRHFSPVAQFPVEAWDKALAVNLSAPFHAIRLALPGMQRRGWGRIVNIASVYSYSGAVDRIDYVTTKTALLGLTRAVAMETAGSEITCNAVAPGVLPTEAILSRLEKIAAEQGVPVEQATRDYIAARQPSGQFVPLESVTGLVAFLCGPDSRGITGAAYPVDGGWTIK